MDSALIIVNPDIVVVPPLVTVPPEFTVLVFLSGLAGLTAESPNEDNQALYFDICCLPSSELDGGLLPRLRKEVLRNLFLPNFGNLL
jgi:hypothetical protein